MLTLIKESWSRYINFRQRRLEKKIINRDKEEHYVMIKESILQEDITVFNVYVSTTECQIHKAKTDRTAWRNRQIHYYSFRLQQTSSSN